MRMYMMILAALLTFASCEKNELVDIELGENPVDGSLVDPLIVTQTQRYYLAGRYHKKVWLKLNPEFPVDIAIVRGISVYRDDVWLYDRTAFQFDDFESGSGAHTYDIALLDVYGFRSQNLVRVKL